MPGQKKRILPFCFGTIQILRYSKELSYFQTDDKTLKRLKRSIIMLELLVIVMFVFLGIYCTIY